MAVLGIQETYKATNFPKSSLERQWSLPVFTDIPQLVIAYSGGDP